MNKLIYKKRTQRIRRKLKHVNKNRFRLSVYRSSRNISAQIIDDKNKKSDISVNVAELLAKKALDKKITQVYFDRGGYKYHGRIKIFAEALRKKGLNF